MNAGESRAAALLLEQEQQLPQGLLQSIIEQQSGWNPRRALLPPHRQANAPPERLAEHKAAARRLQEKLQEFDGIVPLAVDAYYRGDKATRRALQHGFGTVEAHDVYKTLARLPKFGGEALQEQDWAQLQGLFGQSAPKAVQLSNTPVPMPVRPLHLSQDGQGRYRTGDAFLDAVMYIESRGNPQAVSPTGAAGLFQFTRTTGRQYGLISKDGRDLRRDPQANLAAMQRLTADNAAVLRRAGIPVTPTNLYLAHQQGAAGAIEIIRAAQSGREVSGKVRENMNHNNGRGKSAAQFYRYFDEKMQEAFARTGGIKAQPDGTTQLSYGTTGTAADNIPTDFTAALMPEKPAAQAEAEQVLNEASFGAMIAVKARVEQAFMPANTPVPGVVPREIRNAIKGLLAGI